MARLVLIAHVRTDWLTLALYTCLSVNRYPTPRKCLRAYIYIIIFIDRFCTASSPCQSFNESNRQKYNYVTIRYLSVWHDRSRKTRSCTAAHDPNSTHPHSVGQHTGPHTYPASDVPGHVRWRTRTRTLAYPYMASYTVHDQLYRTWLNMINMINLVDLRLKPGQTWSNLVNLRLNLVKPGQSKVKPG